MNAVERVAGEIQAQVLSGAVPVGTRLRQEALAEEFGVSRTPVREALRHLQATGLVELLPNRGAVVRGPSAREIREAYEVRAELEGLAAELAAGRISDRDLLRLREAQALFRESVATLISRRARRPAPWRDESVWVKANDLFHQSILDAAANARLSDTIADLHRSFPRDLTWAALSRSSRLLAENVEQHEAILDAIEQRDPAEARRRMIDHVRSAGRARGPALRAGRLGWLEDRGADFAALDPAGAAMEKARKASVHDVGEVLPQAGEHLILLGLRHVAPLDRLRELLLCGGDQGIHQAVDRLVLVPCDLSERLAALERPAQLRLGHPEVARRPFELPGKGTVTVLVLVPEPGSRAEAEERHVAGLDALLQLLSLFLREPTVRDRRVDAILQRLLERIAQLLGLDSELAGRVVDDSLPLLPRGERLGGGNGAADDEHRERRGDCDRHPVPTCHARKRSSRP